MIEPCHQFATRPELIISLRFAHVGTPASCEDVVKIDIYLQALQSIEQGNPSYSPTSRALTVCELFVDKEPG